MADDDVSQMVNKIFVDIISSLYEIEEFALLHYTSADTFCKMIENKSIWLRNASDMNDLRAQFKITIE